ncbi:WS/DGAT/MGAT family O-acyltransferase [Pseudomarimonas salicorniae]|uniref:diacylglycerol O-acyltransferase n=1 Tax=Pseudomarimonas salicorniae TaxID=2933270 RepID=A0ABT0GJD1_9GAMM|nr:wax ester/triacylglycerol synthase family O-acyltransferase [Lysobacter sp. CAU 1642]MCK7594649.1 wax ester/triacylglycerol synthase family O-acyltransferase [Lysobacter sp. CAU 1642]
MGLFGNAGDREDMAKVDTAWLRMERPTNLMMITGVMMFDTPLELDDLKQLLRERLLAYRRFRQKAVDTPAGAWWAHDEDFDLDWHVRLTALPGKAGKPELQRLVSQLASTPLDHSKPLWQFHLVERYGGGSALITRIHHCYADGIALVQVMLSLTDISAKPKKEEALHESWLKDDGQRVTERFFGPAIKQFDRAMAMGHKLLEKGVDLYKDPAAAAQLVHETQAIAQELAHAVSLSDDPPTVLKGPLGVSKRCAWAEPLDLDEVKAVSRAFCCTVNDVLLASACGALRAHLLEAGEDIDGLSIRATVPVNLRPREHARKLGNHFGLVFLDLPVGLDSPAERLCAVARNMDELKHSKQAMVAYGLLGALGMAPPGVQQGALEMLSRKASLVATNVPGPQQPLYLAGARIGEMMFWVPQTGGIGLGVSILSYNNEVHFGLIADSRRLPDPDAVIARFRLEFEKLLYIALMGDWDAPLDEAAGDCVLAGSAAKGG